jgi:hypothetical protein
LKRLRLFAGFISKVQHNDLWDDFPGTRRWLHRAGIELEVFSEYRIRFFRPGIPKPTGSARVHRFCDFLESRLAGRRQPELRGLADVFRHERNLWDISRRTSESAEDRSPKLAKQVVESTALSDWHGFGRLVPEFNGCVRLVSFDHDPIQLITSLEGGHPLPPTRYGSEPVTLAYWKPPGNPCRILRMEAYEACILMEINGRRSVRTIIARSRANGLGIVLPKQFHEFFLQATASGMLALYEG